METQPDKETKETSNPLSVAAGETAAMAPHESSVPKTIAPPSSHRGGKRAATPSFRHHCTKGCDRGTPGRIGEGREGRSGGSDDEGEGSPLLQPTALVFAGSHSALLVGDGTRGPF